MSREALTPKQPHWTDDWKVFHDNWETILAIPTDPWEVVAREGESTTSSYHAVSSMIDEFLGRSPSGFTQGADDRLGIYREKVDELVDSGPKTLGAAIDVLKKIYFDLSARKDEDIVLDIMTVTFLPYLSTRLGKDLMQNLRQHESYQKQLQASLARDPKFEEDNDSFAYNLAVATAIKLGLDLFRDPFQGY